jgi:hypothetical protein
MAASWTNDQAFCEQVPIKHQKQPHGNRANGWPHTQTCEPTDQEIYGNVQVVLPLELHAPALRICVLLHSAKQVLNQVGMIAENVTLSMLFLLGDNVNGNVHTHGLD